MKDNQIEIIKNIKLIIFYNDVKYTIKAALISKSIKDLKNMELIKIYYFFYK